MRSYSSPVRQSNRGTLAPVYQTASIVRVSSLAEAGANSTATAKRSTDCVSSTNCSLPTSPAAMTSTGAAVSRTSVISSMTKLLRVGLRPEDSCGPIPLPPRKLGGRLHCRFRLGIPRRRLSAAGGLLDALVVHVAGVAVEDDVVLVEQFVDSLDFEQLLFRIVAVLCDGLGQRQRPGADLLQFRHRVLQR